MQILKRSNSKITSLRSTRTRQSIAKKSKSEEGWKEVKKKKDHDVERRKELATVALNKRKQLLDKRKQTENLN